MQKRAISLTEYSCNLSTYANIVIDYIWSISLFDSNCGTESYQNGADFVYTNTLQGQLVEDGSTAFFSQQQNVNLNLKCTVPTDNVIKQLTGSAEVKNDEGFYFDYDFDIYQTNKFNTKLAEHKTTIVPASLYVNLKMFEAAADSKLVTDSCYFSENSDPSDLSTAVYDILS